MDIRAMMKSVVEMPVERPDYLFIFPFGKFRGKTMIDAPWSYLAWWDREVGFGEPLTGAESEELIHARTWRACNRPKLMKFDQHWDQDDFGFLGVDLEYF